MLLIVNKAYIYRILINMFPIRLLLPNFFFKYSLSIRYYLGITRIHTSLCTIMCIKVEYLREKCFRIL